MVNLRVRKPESPVKRIDLGWPQIFDWDRQMFSPLLATMFRPEENLSENMWAPNVDIIEKPDHWLFKAELPDIKPEDIIVTISDGILSIKGERKFEEEVAEGNYIRFERQYGTFERRFSLPTGIDEKNVAADYKNGVLSLTVPKKEEAKPKSVKIDIK